MTESITALLAVLMIAGASAYLLYDFSQYRKRRRQERKAALKELNESFPGTAIGITPPAVSDSSPSTSSFGSAQDRSPQAILPEEARSLLMNAVWYRCENPHCNYTHFLDVYHIDPQANGGANALENLIVLCPACRTAAEKGEIGVDEMRSWVKRRAEGLKFAIDWPYR